MIRLRVAPDVYVPLFVQDTDVTRRSATLEFSSRISRHQFLRDQTLTEETVRTLVSNHFTADGKPRALHVMAMNLVALYAGDTQIGAPVRLVRLTDTHWTSAVTGDVFDLTAAGRLSEDGCLAVQSFHVRVQVWRFDRGTPQRAAFDAARIHYILNAFVSAPIAPVTVAAPSRSANPSERFVAQWNARTEQPLSQEVSAMMDYCILSPTEDGIAEPNTPQHMISTLNVAYTAAVGESLYHTPLYVSMVNSSISSPMVVHTDRAAWARSLAHEAARIECNLPDSMCFCHLAHAGAALEAQARIEASLTDTIMSWISIGNIKRALAGVKSVSKDAAAATVKITAQAIRAGKVVVHLAQEHGSMAVDAFNVALRFEPNATYAMTAAKELAIAWKKNYPPRRMGPLGPGKTADRKVLIEPSQVFTTLDLVGRKLEKMPEKYRSKFAEKWVAEASKLNPENAASLGIVVNAVAQGPPPEEVVKK